ncbi:DUF747-domain-containing protein [Massarina eburnea CBS 473.64]|uniref:DUF747-domain-containing protein n=1 Tax=Massarina eburnea CBS 473.64 TaxID=1395130 RepID=A0A6A6S528_9PLEO|nr:DUF747-domain-containing protein [Massarina eburnea CBS 473.64]
MSKVDYNPNTQVHVPEQLPTPDVPPESEDVFSPIQSAIPDQQQDGANEKRVNGNETLGPRDGISSAGVNDEAVLSDTNELSRPLPQIRRPGDGRRKSSVSDHDKVMKLSPKQMHELTSEPASIPIRTATPIQEHASEGQTPEETADTKEYVPELNGVNWKRGRTSKTPDGRQGKEKEVVAIKGQQLESKSSRPVLSSRSVTTPTMRRTQSSQRNQRQGNAYEGEEKRSSKNIPPPLNLDHKDNRESREVLKVPPQERIRDLPSPMSASMPLPPMSMPTFLSLELSANRPSPLYVYRPATSDFPYESSKIKYERLVNFLLLPPKLEGILAFGALACLDAWMHVLTILPLRFLFAVWILVKWWLSVVVKEARDIWSFVYSGLPRLWKRRRHTEAPTPALNTPADEEPPSPTSAAASSGRENGHNVATFRFPDVRELPAKRMRNRYRHRRTKSTPSALLPSHKADILKGLLVISSCAVLMRFDASRMYHGIRGQSAIKLYVIYNVLEVCDRLLSALGQDVLECLFSRETLDRNPDGRSKVIRPFWMFILALIYNVAHATALFYQVITLNVAVNSYSNALLTLLMSNQFVEIKGTVFKRFEKENLFQVTCADIVERFQLWLMLLIIAMRNIVEVGGLSITSSSFFSNPLGSMNATTTSAPFSASSILPMSFTIFPKYIGQILNPFLLVLGSEMVVDWLKHAYITKFNQTKPEIYGKFLDVLAKDYYSDAFQDPNLTRRLGLPVLPLACLFIRAAIQTYHMFLATHMPLPFPSVSTSLSSELPPTSSPALAHIDHVFRRALGRSTFGAGTPSSQQPWWNPQSWSWSLDDAIAASTMLIVFLVAYLFILAFKILLGMCLLKVARGRYKGMKERERVNVETGGKKLGGFGVVDVTEEKRRWIYNDDAENLKRLRERDEKERAKEERERERGTNYGHVSRYAMVAKRIW